MCGGEGKSVFPMGAKEFFLWAQKSFFWAITMVTVLEIGGIIVAAAAYLMDCKKGSL